MCPASSHFLNILRLSHQILLGQTVSQKPDMQFFDCPYKTKWTLTTRLCSVESPAHWQWIVQWLHSASHSTTRGFQEIHLSWQNDTSHRQDGMAFTVCLPPGLCLFLFMDPSPCLHLPSSSLSPSILLTFNSAPSQAQWRLYIFSPCTCLF